MAFTSCLGGFCKTMYNTSSFVDFCVQESFLFLFMFGWPAKVHVECMCFISFIFLQDCKYIYIYIHIHIHMSISITWQNLFFFLFALLAEILGGKGVMFLLFILSILSSLEATFQSSINAYLLLYFLLATKSKIVG